MTKPPQERGFQFEFGDDYVTLGEAAAYLGMSPRTVRRWAAKGLIAHAVTLGGRRRFRRKTIEDVARQMLDGGPRPGRHVRPNS